MTERTVPSTKRAQTDCGHGHVYTREDGVKARCGGPALCSRCMRDYFNALPANWLVDSSLETWFPITAEEMERTKAERDRYRQALHNIATNKLTSSTMPGPLYGAGVSAGLSIAADMARKALGESA